MNCVFQPAAYHPDEPRCDADVNLYPLRQTPMKTLLDHNSCEMLFKITYGLPTPTFELLKFVRINYVAGPKSTKSIWLYLG